MEPLGLGASAAVALFAVFAGGFIGWRLRRGREDARLQAHEAAIREQINAAGRARDRARQEMQEAEDRFQRVKDEHAGCAARIDQLEQAFAAREAALETLGEELAARDERLVQLETRVESEESEVAALTARLEAIKSLREELAAARESHAGCADREQGLRRKLQELEARLVVSERQREDAAPGWLLRAPDGRKDDLKEIRGLGPVLERDLNRLGIFHFHQLARMTSKDVHWIAGRISSFPGLNKRYRWAEQARGMARHGGNGDSARARG